jgi:hypothetical protein
MIEAAGGLYASAQDLYRLDRALRGDTLLSAATRERMHTAAQHTFGYALGWQVRPIHGRPCARHSGGANGFVADFLRFPDDDACVVVLSNYAFVPILLVSEDVAGILLERDVDPPKVVGRAELSVYAGSYRDGTSTIVVRRCGELLLGYDVAPGATRVSGTPLVALGEHRFRRQSWPTYLRFAVDAGTATELELDATPTRTLSRAKDPASAWRAAAGAYREKGGFGATYRIAVAKERIELRVPSGWGPDLELLPVTETEALALADADFGTVLTLETEGKAGVKGFRWTRADGRVLECGRSGR